MGIPTASTIFFAGIIADEWLVAVAPYFCHGYANCLDEFFAGIIVDEFLKGVM